MAMTTKHIKGRKRVVAAYRKNARRYVESASRMVHGEAVRSIVEGPKTGIIYRRYNPDKWHQASAPGEPPAADTTFLHNQIMIEMDADKMGASIVSNAIYSARLEFGTKYMLPRPFMQPAVEYARARNRDVSIRFISVNRNP